jgi:hypothetical protein
MSLVGGSNLGGGTSDLETDIKSLAMNSPVACTSRIPRGRRPVAGGAGGGMELPPSRADIARSLARDFLSSLSESPAKKRRLDNANKIRKLESDRMRLVNRLKKTKERMRELHKALTDQELDLINLDQEITTLKAEHILDA